MTNYTPKKSKPTRENIIQAYNDLNREHSNDKDPKRAKPYQVLQRIKVNHERDSSITTEKIRIILGDLLNPGKVQIQTYSPSPTPSAISDGRVPAPQKSKPNGTPLKPTPEQRKLRTLNETRKRNARKARARKARQETGIEIISSLEN